MTSETSKVEWSKETPIPWLLSSVSEGETRAGTMTSHTSTLLIFHAILSNSYSNSSSKKKKVIFLDALYFLGPGLPDSVVGAGQLSTELSSYGKAKPGQQQARSAVLLNQGPLAKVLVCLFPHGTQISGIGMRSTLFIAWYENGILFGLICS